MGLFSKSTTYDPMSAFTSEQKKSVIGLQNLAATGTGAGITLGGQYGGALGAYDQGQQGLAGGSALQNLLASSVTGTGPYGTSKGVYESLAGLGEFNPDDPKWGYDAFNKALTKAGAESASVLERESAITGDRFGTAIQGQKADLAENLNLQRQQKLSNIWQGSQQFAALGAQGLEGLANETSRLSGLNINYDEYQRQLKDTQAKDSLNEFKRARGEELSRIGLMQDERNSPLGPITTKSPTAFGNLVSTVLDAAGTAVGASVGGPIGASIGGAIGGGITNFFNGGQTPQQNIAGNPMTSGLFSGAIRAQSGGR